MKTVYLAGPITGLNYEGASDWREYATRMLDDYGIGGVSPMRNKEFLRGRGVLEGSYDEDVLSSARGIITRDRYDCNHADAVIFNLLGAEIVSAGTMIELGWADSARGRPPMIGVRGQDDGVHRHPMVDEIIGIWVPTVEEAVHAAASILAPHARAVMSLGGRP